LEALAFKEGAHGGVVGEELGGETFEPFGTGHGDDVFDEGLADALALGLVANEEGDFGFGAAEGVALETANAEDGFVLLDDEGKLAGVIVEADAGEAFVTDALFELEELEIAEIDGAFGEAIVEVRNFGFVFGADGAQQSVRAIAQLDLADVLRRIRADHAAGPEGLGQFRGLERGPRAAGPGAAGLGAEREDLDLAQDGEFVDETGEFDEQDFEAEEGVVSEGLVDAEAFDEAAGESGGEWGEGGGEIVVDFFAEAGGA